MERLIVLPHGWLDEHLYGVEHQWRVLLNSISSCPVLYAEGLLMKGLELSKGVFSVSWTVFLLFDDLLSRRLLQLGRSSRNATYRFSLNQFKPSNMLRQRLVVRFKLFM